MITLDEAISHAEEQATKLGCGDCAEEHRQLAEWLKELKLRRQGGMAYDMSLLQQRWEEEDGNEGIYKSWAFLGV